MGKISVVTNTKEDIFNFPCEYPIKIFGENQPEFKKTVCNIVETHTGNYMQIKLPLSIAQRVNMSL